MLIIFQIFYKSESVQTAGLSKVMKLLKIHTFHNFIMQVGCEDTLELTIEGKARLQKMKL